MQMKNKKFIEKYGMIIVWLMVYLGIFFMGFVSGMILQQAIIKQGIIDVLSYSDVEVNVNFNETKLVEELNNTFIPAWKQAFNKTIHEQLIQNENLER